MMGRPERVLLLVNGPNLNRLGERDIAVYGVQRLDQIVSRVALAVRPEGIHVKDFQSNHEGELIDFLQREGPASVGVIINPGALGHYGYALRDCIADLAKPCVEVHISNVHRREPFRHQLVLADVVSGQVVGLGTVGYELAAKWLAIHTAKGLGDE